MKSRLRALLGVGSVAALVLAGVAFVGVLPAAASTATLAFTGLTSPQAANTGFGFSVTVSSGGASGDTITITSTNCSVTGGTTTGTYTSSPVPFTGIILGGASTGACNLVATDTPSGGTVSQSVTITPAATHQIAFTTEPATTTPANTAVPFTVKTEDTYGNLETGLTDSVSVLSSCALTGATPVTEVGGVASFTTVSFNSVGGCYLTATDTTASLTATSTLVTVSGGAPAKVAFNVAPPATVAATATLVTPFKAAVEDVNGNIDTTGNGATDSITLSSTCLAAPVSATAVAGVATFSTVEFATTGTCTLTATDASRVIVAALATVQVGTPQAALTVTTKSGYLDAPLTLAASGGSGTGALTFSVTNGTATGCLITAGQLSATKSGTCIVTAVKAAVAPYASGVSAATTVTISSAPHAVKLAGTVRRSHKETVTVSGYNFTGRPKVSSNVSGFSGLVTRDTGKSLSISITVKTSASKPGVKVMTIIFANGNRTSVRYSLH